MAMAHLPSHSMLQGISDYYADEDVSKKSILTTEEMKEVNVTIHDVSKTEEFTAMTSICAIHGFEVVFKRKEKEESQPRNQDMINGVSSGPYSVGV